MSTVVESRVSLVALKGLRSANSDAAKASERLATGLKVNRAGDDPAGLAKATALKAEIASYSGVKRNIGNALSQLGDVTTGVSTILDYLTEMRTLAVASAGEGDSNVRGIYAAQFNELTSSINEITSSVKFNNALVIGAGAGSTAVQVGIYGAAGDSKSLSFSAASASALGVTSGVVSVSATADANTAIGLIDTAIDTLGTHLAKYGAYERSLESYMDMADASILSKSSQYGEIMNTDLALEATNLAAAKIRQDSATAVLAQANSMNRNIADYLLNGALG